MPNNLENPRPVELVPHNPSWKNQFEVEAVYIRNILGNNLCQIDHIGSTVIPEIYAKSVIDILVAVKDLSQVDVLNSEFEKLGYECLGEYGIAGRRFYWKSKLKRTHHIHLFEQGNREIARHLAFRDYLLRHPVSAQGYSWVKRCLAAQFPIDMGAYICGKDSFIRAIDYHAGVAKQDQLAAKDQVILKPYDPIWKKLAAAEIETIRQFIHLPLVAIEHLGSTAIDGLSAKPVIDIFIALESMDQAGQWIEPLKALGYVDWPENPNKLHQRFFKGMPPFGLQRTHHLHMMPMGKKFKDRVMFRDLLCQRADLRLRYETLKQQLAQQYFDDREGYTEAKASFIKEVLALFS